MGVDALLIHFGGVTYMPAHYMYMYMYMYMPARYMYMCAHYTYMPARGIGLHEGADRPANVSKPPGTVPKLSSGPK